MRGVAVGWGKVNQGTVGNFFEKPPADPRVLQYGVLDGTSGCTGFFACGVEGGQWGRMGGRVLEGFLGYCGEGGMETGGTCGFCGGVWIMGLIGGPRKRVDFGTQ